MDDTFLLVIVAVVGVVGLPFAAVGFYESLQHRRQRALATRRKDKFRL